MHCVKSNIPILDTAVYKFSSYLGGGLEREICLILKTIEAALGFEPRSQVSRKGGSARNSQVTQE